jgi:hypothetical protein
LSHVARRPVPDTEGPDAAPPHPAASRLPVAVWVHDAMVCLTVIDEPRRVPSDGICRCAGCHAALLADRAIEFY